MGPNAAAVPIRNPQAEPVPGGNSILEMNLTRQLV